MKQIKLFLVSLLFVAAFSVPTVASAKGGGCYWDDGPLVIKNGAVYIRYYQMCDVGLSAKAYRKTGATKDVFVRFQTPPPPKRVETKKTWESPKIDKKGICLHNYNKPFFKNNPDLMPDYCRQYISTNKKSTKSSSKNNKSKKSSKPKKVSESTKSSNSSKNGIKKSSGTTAKVVEVKAYSNAPAAGAVINADSTGKAKVSFVSSATSGGNEVRTQVMYRKVGDAKWINFGTKSAEDPNGNHPVKNPGKGSVPNKITRAYTDAYGWNCMMGYGDNDPKNCDEVWSNGRVKGKSAFSGYKIYTAPVELAPGEYEWAVRGMDYKTKTYSKTWSETRKFTVKGSNSTIPKPPTNPTNPAPAPVINNPIKKPSLPAFF